MIKKMSETYSVKSAIVFPQHTNNYNTMFGGVLLSQIDDIAAITARRHSGTQVLTASIDSMDFLKPIELGDIVVLEGVVTHTGTSSMEIMVKVSRESHGSNEKKLAGFCFMTFVGVDENGKPVPVPKIECDSNTLQFLVDSADVRVKRRKERLTHTKELATYIEQELF